MPPMDPPQPDPETDAGLTADTLRRLGLDDADELLSRLDRIDRSLELHRREILLLWIAVFGLSGLLVFKAAMALRADA